MWRQAVKSSLGALNGAVLRHCRVSNPPLHCVPLRRGLADVAATGTYLDKAIVTDRVLSVVKNFHKADPSKVTPSAHFQKDLGLDSLDTVELAMAFEEEFAIEIPDKEADKIMTCEDAIAFIASQPNAK